MSRKNQRARLVQEGYSETLLDRLARDGSVKLAAAGANASRSPTGPVHPVVMVQYPERLRHVTRVPANRRELTFYGTWVPDDTHPLGGYCGALTLYRRVNLRKDEMPRWIRDRPLHEFTKERP